MTIQARQNRLSSQNNVAFLNQVADGRLSIRVRLRVRPWSRTCKTGYFARSWTAISRRVVRVRQNQTRPNLRAVDKIPWAIYPTKKRALLIKSGKPDNSEKTVTTSLAEEIWTGCMQ